MVNATDVNNVWVTAGVVEDENEDSDLIISESYLSKFLIAGNLNQFQILILRRPNSRRLEAVANSELTLKKLKLKQILPSSGPDQSKS